MKYKSLELDNATFTQTDEHIEIKNSEDILIPKKLYKYYSIKNHSTKSLINSTLYFSHAHLLNDVMDGNFMLWNIDNFVNNFIKERQGIDKREDVVNEIKGFTEKFLKNRGVLSLSDNYKNELIWVHYTNEQGYCVELDTDNLLNTLKKNRQEKDLLFFPVSYNNLKQIDFADYITKKQIPSKYENTKRLEVNANLPILYCFAQKDKFWAYEKEWRLLINDKNFKSIEFPLSIIDDAAKKKENENKVSGNVNIGQNAINKIILAPLFFNNDRFNKSSIDGKTTRFHFKKNESERFIKEFLQTLKSNFNDKIYQVEKFVVDKRITRDIKYKIQIVKIDEYFVDIIKSDIN